MTRAEKIRQMSDEKMADFLYESADCCFCVHNGFKCDDSMCRDGFKAWLKQEYEEPGEK